MDIAADRTSPLFHGFFLRSLPDRILERDGLQQGIHHIGGDTRVTLQLLQKHLGVLALRKHIARLPAQVLRHQAAGLLCRCAQCIRKLGGQVLHLDLALDQAAQGLHDVILLGLLGRHLLGHHGDGGRGADIRAGATADTLCHINDAVLGVSGSGRTDIQAQAFLGAEPKISHRIFLRHRHALLATRSNFQLGTLQTGQSSGGASPT